MLTNRRRFIKTGGGMAIGALVPFRLVADQKNLQPFRWMTGNLVFSFDVQGGKLRQKCLLPSGSVMQQNSSSGVEVALQCSGENSPDQGMKSGMGQPGARLLFAGYREESTGAGKRLICTHADSLLNLQVDSVYEGFDGVPVVRRHSRVTNNSGAAIGIEFLSSAMLHGLADPQEYDRELRIHVAMNSWMAEGQWHSLRPSEMGFVENERTSWSEARAGSIGGWSTERYRRMACVRASRNNSRCPVIFNDYMNCLWGDPTEQKELPLIAAAGKAGCEYFVIDAGWYAEIKEDWSPTIGSWQPTSSRWPHGLKFVLDQIRRSGMIPGLWLEPEVAGAKSLLAQKPDSWFFVRHGKRVLKNSRFLLDFRNADVRAYLDQVIARLVDDYGVGYIKIDYNVDSLQGTETDSDSVGQGLLEHNRAHLAWLDTILARYPDLTIENCGSGGGRMDYAMLSRLQLQSMTDQEDYLKLPAILVGTSAAVLPEQLAIWSYPLANADADQASFNMVTAMMCRIHQSGHLASLSPQAAAQVMEGIRVYKEVLRKHIPAAVPFYPIGTSDVTNRAAPIALGMRSPNQTVLAVWRIEGPSTTNIPMAGANPKLVYPTDLGINVTSTGGSVNVEFPRTHMACLIST